MRPCRMKIFLPLVVKAGMERQITFWSSFYWALVVTHHRNLRMEAERDWTR